MPLSLPNPISFEGVVVAGTALLSQSPRGTPPARSMASAIGGVTNRMEIHDRSRILDDPDPALPNFLEVHFNPKEFEEKIKVAWTEVPIPGQSHKLLHYHLTENAEFRFDLHFDTMQAVSGSPRGSKGQTGTEQAKRFLQSLCYSKENPQSIRDAAPPQVLLYWPNFMATTVVVTEQTWKYTMFHSNGTPRLFTCSMMMKEVRSTKITSSKVLKGTTRAAPFPPQGDSEHLIKV